MPTPEINGASEVKEKENTKLITLAIIGCGQRGLAYADYVLRFPGKCKIVAIAEPRPKALASFAEMYAVPEDSVYSSWQALHRQASQVWSESKKKLADAVVVAVQDRMHYEVVCAFAELGYDILCEKPMGTSVEECMKMVAAVKKAGIIFGVGHVLRYSPYNQAVAEVIRHGNLGKLINIQHLEPIGHWHFSHSYVRGSWAKEESSSFSLMTKSCHDIDIICAMLAPAKPTRVSSFGSLQHFKKSEKPVEAGLATRCLDCSIANECPYSARRIYLEKVQNGFKDWPIAPLVDGIPDIENITEALRTGPYGLCVYESDNDVVDHQIVNLEFSNGATASFTMAAFTTLICERQTRLHFTHGELVGNSDTAQVTDFRKQETVVLRPEEEGGGHGGGDMGLIRAFTEAVRTRDQMKLGVDVDGILRSHLTVFAAESSRREGRVVNMEEFELEAKK